MTIKFYTKHAISKKERKKLAMRLRDALGDPAQRKVLEADKVEVAKTKDGLVLYYIDEVPLFVELEGRIIPTVLGAQLGACSSPYVVVDAGAVPHILNGADVMVPGIVSIKGDFREGAIVIVVDEKKRVLAVGTALMSSDRIRQEKKGKAIKNLHYVGDKLWKVYMERRFLRLLGVG